MPNVTIFKLRSNSELTPSLVLKSPVVSEATAEASVADDNSSVGAKDDDDDDDDDDASDDRADLSSCADPEKLKAFNVSHLACGQMSFCKSGQMFLKITQKILYLKVRL
jgi:hypothetical protein